MSENPESAEANYALGLCYLNSRLRDAAIQHLRKAALQAPEVVDTHLNLALALLNDGHELLDSMDFVEAVRELDYCCRLAPGFPEAEAFKYFILGLKLVAVDGRQAWQEFNKAVEYCPDIALLQNRLGIAYLTLPDFANADRCFQRAIALSPRDYTGYAHLCNLCLLQGQFNRGIQIGYQAVNLLGPGTTDGGQAYVYNNLGMCIWELNHDQAAIEHIKKAIAFDPGNPVYHANLKRINEYNPHTALICALIGLGIIIVLFFGFR